MSGPSTLLRVGNRSYRWVEGWAQLPDTDGRRRSWPHTALAINESGEITTFDQVERALVSFDQEGRLVRSVPVDIDEAHGITLVVEGGASYVWLADASVGKRPESGYAGKPDATSMVVKADSDGRIVMSLQRPPHDAYKDGEYRPTCVAVDEERHGGSGNIWVGDGYGSSYVHRYDRRGRYLGSLSGEEGGGRFKGPHAVYIDRRRKEPELYIADRANARIQVYGMDAGFHRLIEGFFSRPTWFAAEGEALWVVEFTPPRLTLLDKKDAFVGYLAEGPLIIDRPGWPNELDDSGNPRRPSLQPGKLNSPHSAVVDERGNLYVSEYIIGGRISQLAAAERA